jgi:hypothetical protein
LDRDGGGAGNGPGGEDEIDVFVAVDLAEIGAVELDGTGERQRAGFGGILAAGGRRALQAGRRHVEGAVAGARGSAADFQGVRAQRAAVQAQRAALDGEAGRGQAGREEQNREDDEAAAHGSSGR